MVDLHKHYGRVFGFFRSRGFLVEEAWDLTQETFLRALRRIDKLRSPVAVGRWILKIAKRVWINELRYRKASKRNGVNVSLAEIDQPGADSAVLALMDGDTPNPLGGLLTAERLAIAQFCMEGLQPGIRQCLRMYACEDFTYQEIADILQIPINTVKSNIHDGRSALRRCVEQRLAGDA